MGTRMSAAERREMTITAAMAEFARGGYEGTSTASIAERVGVSQPYLFRLFPTKRALFLAAAERCFEEIEDAMREAAGGLYGRDAMAAMAEIYRRILREDPTLLQFQLQIYAAAVQDEEIARLGHRRWAGLWCAVRDLSGEDAAEVTRFMSIGLLVNVLTAFGVPHTSGPDLPCSLEKWAYGVDGGDPGEGT
ncbi:TetR/AcrR family transcriptional regulator [Actinomadura darangshiensis]|uniref:TetR/AcrR family transcriptional regulator n=1 Tax=Actinomadura darangshiensis TaxID=705336 RepID=A0A4R5BJR6_9ACTN|nr:TetR/AcrR family transcriptional regulator [Actinomadura darangshiensis]TDD85386.1 TetR/AcrR family transcriptional regulator [Actinomadura darangshiensis]